MIDDELDVFEWLDVNFYWLVVVGVVGFGDDEEDVERTREAFGSASTGGAGVGLGGADFLNS